MNRAWSIFELKSFDDDARTFEGIASTPTTDRMGDIVEPKGAIFKLPITMMWQHGKGSIKDPVGWITSAKVTEDEISVKGRFAKVEEPASLKEDLDRAWALVKSKLVRGLSIGFNPIESVPIKNSFGERFTSWEWLELSPVAIAANQESLITSIKSADALLLAASGHRPRVVTLANLPGVSGPTRSKGNSMTIKEQIDQFENKRAAHDARITAIMDKSTAEGRTLDETETQEYDGLQTELKSIDEHLVRLRAREKQLAATATAITKDNTADSTKAANARGGIVQVVSRVDKGIGFARAAMALMACKGNRGDAIEQAKKHWPDMGAELEIVLKAEQLPGTTTGTTWALPLIQTRLTDEFLEMLRPATIIGRIPRLRRVPFNISMPGQTGGGTYSWVGENAPKPVSGLALNTTTLRWAKVAGIIPFTKEAMKFSNPSIEAIVRDDMIKGAAQFLDTQFIDPAVHESVNVSPGSITDQIVNTAASGTTAAAFRADFRNILGKFIINNENPTDAVILMSATVAMNLSSLMNSLGQAEFPTVSLQGGSYLGIPIIVSQAVGARIILLNPTQILIAYEDGVTIDISEEASVVMTTTPASSPAATSLVSFWQNNLIGLRMEQFITWKRSVTAAVEYLSTAVYGG